MKFSAGAQATCGKNKRKEEKNKWQRQHSKDFAQHGFGPSPRTAREAYATSTMVPLPGAQQLTKDTSRSEYTIYADDGVYDSGSDFQYEDLTFTVAELTPELEAKLSGGSYDETEKVYTFKASDLAPEFAFGYAAMKLDGTYRMFKHYVVKLLSVKVDHASKGDTGDIAAYQLTLRATQRKADGKIRDISTARARTTTGSTRLSSSPKRTLGLRTDGAGNRPI